MKVLRVVTYNYDQPVPAEYQSLYKTYAFFKTKILEGTPALKNFDFSNHMDIMVYSELHRRVSETASKMVKHHFGLEDFSAIHTAQQPSKIVRYWRKCLKFLHIQDYYEIGLLGSTGAPGRYVFELTFKNQAALMTYLLKYGE